MSCRPYVTVAAVIRYQDRFLLVEEMDRDRHVFNQPAGHLEFGESLTDAICREIHEETGLHLQPDGWLGTYMFISTYRKATYLRFCFYCELQDPPGEHHPQDPDNDILACHWKTVDEIRAMRSQLRSSLVMECLDDYLAGVRLPLTTLKDRR